MFRRSRAFTLAELLVVLAIIAILAGLLFPVFAAAKAQVKRVKCVSNMHMAQLAVAQYVADYDDYFMPVNHRPAGIADPLKDRTWVQLILPYARSFDVFHCPADTSANEIGPNNFDEDLVPGDIYARYYTASLHVDLGFNYVYLSPILWTRNGYISQPKMMEAVGDPSKTLMFADSIWDRLPNGQPTGGGNWLIVPPCRYTGSARHPADTFDGLVYTPFIGWASNQPDSPHLYGNVWPWHYGRVNITRVDGSVSSVTVDALTQGCDVGAGWSGNIKNLNEYLWDTH